MEEFTIQGGSDFIKLSLENVYGFPTETCHWGGYDAKCLIGIECGAFSVNANFYSSTGEFYQFYEHLSKVNEFLKGEVYFTNYEGNLELSLIYDLNGHISINGSFRDTLNGYYDTELKFHFKSDQSYIQSTISQLKIIVDKYGGMKGIK